eukprot:593812-Rhodomonas_salina.1
MGSAARGGRWSSKCERSTRGGACRLTRASPRCSFPPPPALVARLIPAALALILLGLIPSQLAVPCLIPACPMSDSRPARCCSASGLGPARWCCMLVL